MLPGAVALTPVAGDFSAPRCFSPTASTEVIGDLTHSNSDKVITND
jgi:hypothetical protein